MTEDIDKAYVRRCINKALDTDNPDLRQNMLYRAGTHMEVIESDGNDKLSPDQQQFVLDAAAKLLRGETDG